ncbi:MAG TPA: carboxymuconolactone decarboxylase family protein [Candidatus Binataceae bacterium]|nr:carboxymuconolactone decarboxylase family protein [Candidatus Binataceae bacterium]
MGRLPYVTRNELAEADRGVWDDFVKSRGSEPMHIHRTVANAPKLLRRFVALADECRNGTALDPKLRELALMTVGRLTGAEYEFVHHWNISLRAGVRREQLEQLADYAASPVFDANERAVMRYAEEATRNVRVSELTFDALRDFLDNRRIMELVMNVALYNAVARVIVPCAIELEAGAKKD